MDTIIILLLDIFLKGLHNLPKERPAPRTDFGSYFEIAALHLKNLGGMKDLPASLFLQ
jgi:hypothetical protein